MTVSELMDILSTQDGNKQVLMWNPEWNAKDPIEVLEVDEECVLLA